MSDLPNTDDEIIVETGRAEELPPVSEDERPVDLSLPLGDPVPEDEREEPGTDAEPPSFDGTA